VYVCVFVNPKGFMNLGVCSERNGRRKDGTKGQMKICSEIYRLDQKKSPRTESTVSAALAHSTSASWLAASGAVGAAKARSLVLGLLW